jgi:putative spermidine/putrescine transport system substrate-binding protein
MNGGQMEKAYTQYVFPAFEKAYGAKVVVVPGTSSDILAKAQANKDKPQMHVMFLDDGIMVRAIHMGLCEKQRDSPVLKDIYPAARLKNDMATGVSLGMTGLAYNKKMFTEKGWAAPTSWMDLADPKYKGKVVFQSMPSSTFGLHGFLMFNRIQGGTDRNVEPGFKAWPGTIGPNVLEYIPSSAKISEMVQTGEAALFPLTPTAVAGLKAKGIPVEYAQPKEGSVVLMVAQCVIAATASPNWPRSSPSSCSAAGPGQCAAVRRPDPDQSQGAGGRRRGRAGAQINGYMKNAVTVDWDAINEQRPAWNAAGTRPSSAERRAHSAVHAHQRDLARHDAAARVGHAALAAQQAARPPPPCRRCRRQRVGEAEIAVLDQGERHAIAARVTL